MTAQSTPARLHTGPAPFVRDGRSVRSLMLWTLGGLTPALIIGCILFGMQAALLVIAAVASAMATELVLLLYKKKPAIPDASAALTGLILGLSLAPHTPVWIAVLGSVFAIAVVKAPFGGLGRNLLNPAMAARAMLMLCFPAAMSAYVSPWLGSMNGIDAMSAATPLTAIKTAMAGDLFQPLDFQDSIITLFLGNTGGSIGGTSAAAIMLGAVVLMYKRIISIKMPAFFIGTVFLLSWVFNPAGELFTADALIVPTYQILCGGLFFAAFFVANDPVTSPVTSRGRIIFATGCGALTWAFRMLGPHVEGVTFAILMMNCLVPLINRFTGPRPKTGE